MTAHRDEKRSVTTRSDEMRWDEYVNTPFECISSSSSSIMTVDKLIKTDTMTSAGAAVALKHR